MIYQYLSTQQSPIIPVQKDAVPIFVGFFKRPKKSPRKTTPFQGCSRAVLDTPDLMMMEYGGCYSHGRTPSSLDGFC